MLLTYAAIRMCKMIKSYFVMRFSHAPKGGVLMRKQAKLMEFGLNYQRFADYQDKVLVVEISYSNV